MQQETACDLSNPVSVYGCLVRHLHAICAVEFYTIPVYLTAAYSFSVAAQSSSYTFTPAQQCGSGSPGTQNFVWWMQQQAISVAVQEMYHLQCAANLADAFGAPPDLLSVFNGYDWTGPVPHLKSASLPNGPGNLSDVMTTLQAIEASAGTVFPPPNQEALYDSITQLYHATLTLMEALLASLAPVPLEPGPVLPPGVTPVSTPAANQIAYQTFVQRYQYNTVQLGTFFDDIRHLMNAVSFQGEGASVTANFSARFPTLAAVVAKSAPADTGDIPAQYQPRAGSRFARWDCKSHYVRFTGLAAMMASTDFTNLQSSLPSGRTVFNSVGSADPDRPSWVVGAEVLQTTTNKVYSYLLDVLVRAMTSGGGGLDAAGQRINFTQAMTSFKYLLPQLWQWGEVSTFSYISGVTQSDLQAAMDAADPLCLYHWDAATLKLRQEHPKELNVCQGLNSCKGRGWGALATAAGNGACATLDIHTCVQGNACAHQGACGFVAAEQPCANIWVPGQNSGKGNGGCQVPIATGQKFSCSLPAGCDKTALKGTSVWEEARSLLAAQLKVTLPAPQRYETPTMTYDGTKRRAAITPTST
ncbi:MAG TPA: ferritin-like domain-containing protein [Polyangiaceae bacterium]|nr:ferritin-like domain-containing protein [Polyangiaceae bacterium]